MKFYPLKIYFLAILLNIIPVIVLILNDWSSDELKLMGCAYLIFLLLMYLPFLFISQEKSKAKILFFLPSVFSIVILSIVYLILNGLDMSLSLIILAPNLILQAILFLDYSKKINVKDFLKFFRLIFFSVCIILIGLAIPEIIVNTILDDKLIRELLQAMVALILFALYSFHNRNKEIVFQSPIIPKSILWILPFVPTLVSFINPLPKFELNSFLKVLFICLSIGIAEEIIFRGVLFRLFQKTKFPIYLLVSAILFGLVHLGNGTSGILAATMGGLIFGLARVSGFPLLLLIICHAAYNIPMVWKKHGNVFNESLTINPLFNTSYSILFIITLLITIIYLSIPKHWTDTLNIRSTMGSKKLL